MSVLSASERKYTVCFGKKYGLSRLQVCVNEEIIVGTFFRRFRNQGGVIIPLLFGKSKVTVVPACH